MNMTDNTFGVALCRVSVVMRKVCYVLAYRCGPKYIKMPTTKQEMLDIVNKMETSYWLPTGIWLCGWNSYSYLINK